MLQALQPSSVPLETRRTNSSLNQLSTTGNQPLQLEDVLAPTLPFDDGPSPRSIPPSIASATGIPQWTRPE